MVPNIRLGRNRISWFPEYLLIDRQRILIYGFVSKNLWPNRPVDSVPMISVTIKKFNNSRINNVIELNQYYKDIPYHVSTFH